MTLKTYDLLHYKDKDSLHLSLHCILFLNNIFFNSLEKEKNEKEKVS